MTKNLRNLLPLCLALAFSLLSASSSAQQVFSSQYGEHWLRMETTNAARKTVVWAIAQGLDATSRPVIAERSYSDAAQLWCFVGNENKFKIFNKALGGSLCLSAVGAKNAQPALDMVPANQATFWSQASLSSPSGSTSANNGAAINTKVSLLGPAQNLAGKIFVTYPAKRAKYAISMLTDENALTASPLDAATHWDSEDATQTVTLTVATEGNRIAYDKQNFIAQIELLFPGNIQKRSRINLVIGKSDLSQPQTYYLPGAGQVTLNVLDACRGYSFKGWTINDSLTSADNSFSRTTDDRQPNSLNAVAMFGIDASDSSHCLFRTFDGYNVPYRIPAIAQAPNGDIIALSDRRYCRQDIGYGHIDIVARNSRDNGATWGEDYVVLRGGGTGLETGFGDACLVADRESNKMLLVCDAGDLIYPNSTPQHHQFIVRSTGTFDKLTGTWLWSKYTDFTASIYDSIFHQRLGGMFMASGKICQSRRVKVGKYFRLYGALITHIGNFVIYSDNFGDSWKVLGSADSSCVPKGNEPKCEELPDGSVVISSREDDGRWFNIFRFTNARKAEGTWGEPVASQTVSGGIKSSHNQCNGEILVVPVRRVADNVSAYLVLQSVPAGPDRTNVTIYYKPLLSEADYETPLKFASAWEGKYLVSPRGSAYSTMILKNDGNVAFYFEEEPSHYQMVYLPLSISKITNGAYEVLKK